jgi:hypothetical protein
LGRPANFDGDGVADVLSSRKGYFASFIWDQGIEQPGVNGRWCRVPDRAIEQLRFGDFDGDGVTDVFRKDDDNTWKVTYATKDRTARWFEWKPVRSARVSHSPTLASGTFDGKRYNGLCSGRMQARGLSLIREKDMIVADGGKWEKDQPIQNPCEVTLLPLILMETGERTRSNVSPVETGTVALKCQKIRRRV